MASYPGLTKPKKKKRRKRSRRNALGRPLGGITKDQDLSGGGALLPEQSTRFSRKKPKRKAK